MRRKNAERSLFSTKSIVNSFISCYGLFLCDHINDQPAAMREHSCWCLRTGAGAMCKGFKGWRCKEVAGDSAIVGTPRQQKAGAHAGFDTLPAHQTKRAVCRAKT